MARTSSILTQDHASSSPAFKVTIQRTWRMRGCHVVRRCGSHVMWGKNASFLDDVKFGWGQTWGMASFLEQIHPWKLRFWYSKRPYLKGDTFCGIHVKFLGCQLQHVAAFLFNLCWFGSWLHQVAGGLLSAIRAYAPWILVLFDSCGGLELSWSPSFQHTNCFSICSWCLKRYEMILKWMMKWSSLKQQKKHIEMLVNHPTNFLLFWFRVCCVNLTGQILCHVGSFIACTNDPVVSGRAPHLRCRPETLRFHALLVVINISQSFWWMFSELHHYIEETKHEYHHSILKTPKKTSGFFFFA